MSFLFPSLLIVSCGFFRLAIVSCIIILWSLYTRTIYEVVNSASKEVRKKTAN